MDAIMNAFGGWTPLFSILLITAIYALGEKITALTKGLISSMMVASIVFITLYVSKIIPSNVPMNSTLGSVSGAFSTLMVITHLGTIINLKDFVNEWKTVVLCLVGFIGIILACVFVGAPLLGRMEAYTAIAPIAGGIVATQLTAEVATANGYPEMATFAFLVMSFQGLIGMPIASFFLKRECEVLIKRGDHLVAIASDESTGDASENKPEKTKFFKPVSPEKNTWLLQFTKLAFVAWLATIFSMYMTKLTKLSLFAPAVMVLFFGIIFHELGFLDSNIANKAGIFNVFMLALYHSAPSNYATLEFSQVVRIALPLFGLLIVGACGIIAFSLVAAKPIKYSSNMAIACGLAAMFGFPGTLILTTDAVKGTGLPDEQRQNLMDRMLPRMLVAGFATVTVSSVILAGIISPMIFTPR